MMNLSGADKTTQLVGCIEERMNLGNIDSSKKEELQYILTETKHFIKYGEWFIGFENMLSNLDEYHIKLEAEELILAKEIFQIANVDWQQDWAWIDDLQK